MCNHVSLFFIIFITAAGGILKVKLPGLSQKTLTVPVPEGSPLNVPISINIKTRLAGTPVRPDVDNVVMLSVSEEGHLSVWSVVGLDHRL